MREGCLSKLKDYLVLFGIAGVIVALDQITKYKVRTELLLGETWSPFEWLEKYARIVHWNNTGAAFGILPSASKIFTIIAIVVVIAIIYYYPRVPKEQVAIRIALALQLGGALGNLLSRLLVGTVTDFISVLNFAVWNVADASITIGTALLIIAMLVEERKQSKTAESDSPEDEAGVEETLSEAN
jgi:signal peptidase II